MADIGSAVRAVLQADSGVTDLVSARVYPIQLPQNATLPAVTFQLASAIRANPFDGPNGLVQSRLQIDCWGNAIGSGGYLEAKSVMAAVRQALNGYDGTADTVAIKAVQMEAERDLFEDETAVPRVSADFMIWHDEET